MPVRRSFDAATLTRLRAMPMSVALELLSVHAKTDPTYLPLKDQHSQRWHVATVRGEFEILITGVKWFDTRAQSGGGGAIDLAMHLLGLSFVDAVTHLVAKEGQHGPDDS
ncbi:hypothetical protein R75461_08181 [Paraburkholderia nemoris]|nr:hypothetical protein [Paraburkholderia aspalathi]MBK3786877.1 hypothetical protein [Paraburkholderia aspalathi]CAE6864457.1 hypothetical protein R75461_08181 [Paraburkholderia nemoris]